MGHDIKEQKALVFNDGGDAWSTTTCPTVGLAVKNAIFIPEKTANKYFITHSLLSRYISDIFFAY
jgi:hypothetical protein